MIAHGEVVNDELTSYLEQVPAALRDPYPVFTLLRKRQPVYQRSADEVLLFRYRDVQAAFADVRNSKDLSIRPYPEGQRIRGMLADTEAILFDEVRAFENLQMSRTDDPTHARLRALAQQAFTPRRIAAMSERIQAIVDKLVSEMKVSESVDFIDAFAYRLPILVIFDLLGVEPEARDDIRAWSEDMARFRSRPDDTQLLLAAHAAIQAFSRYVHQHIDRAKAAGGSSDLMWALVQARYRDNRLSEAELTATIVHLLFAGHETTTNLIGNGLHNLLRYRQQWETLRAQPELIEGAVEELLRYDTPILFQHRMAKTDHEMDGVLIREGTHLVLVCGSANRDPDQFANADEFDVTRRDIRHVSFGYGPHFCLGASLARMEARIAFSTLIATFPKLEIAVDLQTLEWGGPAFRGLKTLPVAVSGRRAASHKRESGGKNQ